MTKRERGMTYCGKDNQLEGKKKNLGMENKSTGKKIDCREL